MVKGSQLTQLKAALNKAGITGPTNPKKRKRSVPLEKDKERKAAQLEGIQRRLNPFDTKVTKLKHDIGGRKLKGITGKPAKSKQAGIERRKATLLKEYAEKDRAGGIVDRRFGENDPTMSLEEKMLERFTKERQRASKGTAFTLEDEDDLTHYGRSLSKMDDFDNVGLRIESDEEEDETSGQIDRDIVSRTHFGGFGDEGDVEDEDGPPRKKTKAEVMAEVVAKSKEHKLRRQMDKEKADEIRHELDDDFATLRSLLFATPSEPVPSRSEDPAPEAKADDAIAAQLIEGHADYDQHVRELAFEKRAKPKDRTKTEEELALEQKEALEKAERRRRKRMLGEPESESDDEGKPRGKRKRGGDDLDDGMGEWDGLGAGLVEAGPGLSGSEDEGSEEGEEDEDDAIEEGSEDDEGAIEDEEDEEDESGEDDDEEDEEARTPHEDLVKTSRKEKSDSGRARRSSTKYELPYTFPCPETHEEFLEIVEDIRLEDVPTVIQRIRTLFHTSLAAENKFKLQTFGKVLIDHVLFVTSRPSPNFALVNTLFPHIHAITKAYPVPLAQYFNEKLTTMHKNLKRGLARGPTNTESKTWPAASELSLLRLIGLLWSSSDLNHAVVSPTRVLMAAYLGLGRVRSLVDVASGLFLCTLWLQYEALSQRLVPEVINFVLNSLLHLAPHSFRTRSELPLSFASPDFGMEHCQGLRMSSKARKSVVDHKPDLANLLNADTDPEQAKADLLGLALTLLGRFAELSKSLDGFIELYEPGLNVLQHIEKKRLPAHLSTQLEKQVDMLTRLLKFAKQGRKSLRLQAHKPIPIPTYVPKFETTTSNYLRSQDPDHEKNQLAKMRNEYKQERKGAIRELRKDARFLAAVQQKEAVEKSRAYNERMRRVFGSIEGERAEQKKMEKEKAKEKRRSGKK